MSTKLLISVQLFNNPSFKDANAKKRRRPGEDAARFKTDEGTGKMVIDDKANEDEAMEEDVAGAAYKESLTSVDGFTRGPNGRVKFNKDTKKRRRENEDEDVEMGEAQEPGVRRLRLRMMETLSHACFVTDFHVSNPRKDTPPTT